MKRFLALAGVILAAVPAGACKVPVRERLPQPVVGVATSDVVVVGTVTSVESDPVMAKSHPDATAEEAYRVLVVKVEKGLVGANQLTHVRLAVPAAEFDRIDHPLREGVRSLLFLNRHSTTNLLLPRSDHPPLRMDHTHGPEAARRAAVAAAALADPVKALQADEQFDRTLAAVALATHYRRIPAAPNGYEAVPRPADESRLLLAALAEATWTSGGTADAGNPYGVVLGLGLEFDGFKMPGNTNGQDPAAAGQVAFQEWLAGQGKDARIKQQVAKK